MNVQYQQERQVKAVADKYHRDAIKAQHIRLARGDRPSPVAEAAMSIKTSVSSLIHSVTARLRQQQAMIEEPTASPEIAAFADQAPQPAESVAKS